MAPWDEYRYFDLPTETLFTNPVAGSPIVSANPMRVGLILSTKTAAVFVSTKPNLAVSQGIQLTTQAPTLILTQKDNGILTQIAWFFGSGGAGVSLTAIELVLHAWKSPEDQTNGESISWLSRLIRSIKNTATH